MEIQEKLKIGRAKAKLSLNEATAKSGVSKRAIQNIEAAKVSPTVITIQKLMLAYGIKKIEISCTD